MASFDAVAMPSEAELQKVKPILKTLTEDDYAALKAGKKTRSELADSLLGYVGEAESEAAKFSLIQAAFKNYMEVYESEKAVMAFDALASNVKDVPRGTFGDWCSPHVVKFAKNGRADALAVLLNKALDSGDAKSTSALMSALNPYMRKLGAGAKTAATPFAAAVERATRQERRARELAALKAAVKKNPSDASAHEKYGLAIAASGDWDAALKEFALASGPVAEAASWEAKWPNAGESSWTPSKAAELWWDRADAAKDEDAASVLRGRSVAWYKIAIDKGELTGLRKTIAEKRIKEAGESGAAAAAIASAPTPVVERNDPPSRRRSRRSTEATTAPATTAPVPVADVAPVKIKGGPWMLPKTFATPLERSLDLGGGVQMPFCACPAGSFRMMDHKVTITRPFWISKTVVSLNQLAVSSASANYLRYVDNGGSIDKFRKQFANRFSTIVAPMEVVSNYAKEFTRKYRGVLPPGYVFRLPTEAEMYYAYYAGMDEDVAEMPSSDDVMTNTGEALSELGWVPKANVWDWKSIPRGYGRLATLPDANAFGVVPWSDRLSSSWILDTLNFDANKNTYSGSASKDIVIGKEGIKSVMNYATEEIDPLRTGNHYAEVFVHPAYPRRRFVKGHIANFLIVIGPDLESEKKAAGK